MSQDQSSPRSTSPRSRRERSTRYPGVPLAEGIKLCESIEELGVDGLPAAEIALALGYKNIKTNTFSARLSAARQFGLLTLTGEGYALTSLAREILHPIDPSELRRYYRQALLKPSLYAELAERLGGKKVPEASILGNVLYHNHQIIASAKQAAAEAFLESARFAGALGEDHVFQPEGPVVSISKVAESSQANGLPLSADVHHPSALANSDPTPRPSRSRPGEARLDLRLWDDDNGKTIRLRAPQSITLASFERFLQAFRLLVKVEDPPEPLKRD